MKIYTPENLGSAEPVQLLPDEKVLIELLRSKCPLSFKKLYKMYSAALMGVIGRIVNCDEIAQDLLQEAFVKIWNSIDKYDESKGRLFTWMISMTRNLAIDYIRSKTNLQSAKRSPIDEMTGAELAHHQDSMNPDAIGIKALTGHLKGIEKEILDLIYFQGYTQAETAEHLDIPLGTVKTKLRRAIGKLRNLFLPADFEKMKIA